MSVNDETNKEEMHEESIIEASQRLKKEEDNEKERLDREEKEKITVLKVKSDPRDISPDDRKRNVKKLAGAVSHALRAQGEISARAFGNPAIGKASKALAIAQNNIKVNGKDGQQLQLECAPGFVETDIHGKKVTGISFNIFASDAIKTDDEIKDLEHVLMVKADPHDIDPDTRAANLHKLAGAINYSLKDHQEIVIRSFGNAAIGKAVKSIAIARGWVATRGPDLYCWPIFIVAEINGAERTGIAWYCYTNA